MFINKICFHVKKQYEPVKVRQENWRGTGFLMPHDPFLGFEMKIYYQNEHKFKCVHSKSNLSKIKDEAYTAEKVKKCLMENFIFYAVIEAVIELCMLTAIM